RTAHRMGIRTVAVYSEADRAAMHTAICDEAIAIGPPAPAESYLRIDGLIEAAKTAGADAIHPGYGFLSERPEFVEACQTAGLVFVGPSAAAMRALGDKSRAKTLAVRAGVPVVPGLFEDGATRDDLRAAADRIGYPALLKARAGGGGRGMRIVRAAEEFDAAFETATDEALKAFGDGAMMIERLIERPRHIEVQLLADGYGTVAALFERECSVQRRHQKLIEEAPSPWFAQHPDRWPALRDAAISLAREAGYVGAGTCEFILDPASGEFYFLEVNARLQVEHPVTEAVTGLDLVAWQLRIAAGERLELPAALLDGDRSALKGWAVEARIVAEDPAQGFLPSAGRLSVWAEPRHPGIRVDSGFRAGDEVSRFYDSLLAKAIASGDGRDEALDRLRAALLDFPVLGVPTNAAFLIDALDHPDYRGGAVDTGWVDRTLADWSPPERPEFLADLLPFAGAESVAGSPSKAPSAWDATDGFRNAAASTS
ncbi:ATP-grasp domain-containing protein, partial [bacterium]